MCRGVVPPQFELARGHYAAAEPSAVEGAILFSAGNPDRCPYFPREVFRDVELAGRNPNLSVALPTE
jgi:hypothetical protein